MEQETRDNVESLEVESDGSIQLETPIPSNDDEDEEADEEVERLTSPSPTRPSSKIDSQTDPQAALMAGLEPKYTYIDLPPEKHDNHIEADALSGRPSNTNVDAHPFEFDVVAPINPMVGSQWMDLSLSAASSMAGTPVYEVENPRRQKYLSESSTSGVMLGMEQLVLDRMRSENRSSKNFLIPVHVGLFDLRTYEFSQIQPVRLEIKVPGPITDQNSDKEFDVAGLILKKHGNKENDVVWTVPKHVTYRDIVQSQHVATIKAVICRTNARQESDNLVVAFIQFIETSDSTYPRKMYAGILDHTMKPSEGIEWCLKKRRELQKKEDKSLKDTEFKAFIQQLNSPDLKLLETFNGLVKFSTVWIVSKIPITATLMYYMSDNAKLELYYNGHLTDTLFEMQQGIIQKFANSMGIANKFPNHIWLSKVINDSLTCHHSSEASISAFLHLKFGTQRFLDFDRHFTADDHFLQMIKIFEVDVEDPLSVHVTVNYRKSKIPMGRRSTGYNTETLVIIPPNCSVAYLKRKLMKRFSIPPERQKLQLDKTKLRDDRTLQSYSHFKEKCVITLMEATPMKIILMCNEEKSFSMDVFKAQTVQSVKANLGMHCGNISPYFISLNMADSGANMESESYLYQYNISRSSDTIIRALYFPKRADITIVHRLKKFACTVDEPDICTVKKLKEHLVDSTKIATKDQVLISQGQCLEDSAMVEGHRVIIVAEKSKTWWHCEQAEAKEVKEPSELRIVCQSGYKNSPLVENQLYEAAVVKGKMYLDYTPLDPAGMEVKVPEDLSLTEHGSCCGIKIIDVAQSCHYSNVTQQGMRTSTPILINDTDALDSISSTKSSETAITDTMTYIEQVDNPLGNTEATCTKLEADSESDGAKERAMVPIIGQPKKIVKKHTSSHDFPMEMFSPQSLIRNLKDMMPSADNSHGGHTRVKVEVKQKRTSDEWCQSFTYSSDTNTNTDMETDSGLSVQERSGSIQPQDLGPDCVSELELCAIAKEMGKDGKRLGRKLSVKENDLIFIERNYKDDQHEQNVQFLYKWKEKAGRGATKGILAKALNDIDKGEIVDKFQSIFETTSKNDSVGSGDAGP